MKNAKKLLSLILALCLTLTFLPTAALAADSELPFVDVSTADWFYDAVRYVYAEGMMNGTDTSHFAPNSPTTRGMIVVILHRLENTPSGEGKTFDDVPAGQWYSDAVAWASANGIVSGYGNGMFGPNNPITREQMVVILYRYSQYKGFDTDTTGSLANFSDAGAVSSYATAAMSWAVKNGLITGVGGNTLLPGANAIRAQAASILTRYCQTFAASRPSDTGMVYAITDLAAGRSAVTATVSTQKDCVLSIQVVDELSEAVLFTASAPASKQLNMEEVQVPVTGTLPAHFILRAVLMDEAGNELSNPFTTRRYTSAWEKFKAQTPGDFPDAKVLDFGSNGFGVLADGVIEVPGAATATDQNTYTVETSASIQSGDVLLLHVDGVETPIKVDTMTDNGDGTLSIVSEDNINVSDLYQVLNLEAVVDVGSATQPSSRKQFDGSATPVELKAGITAQNLKVEASGSVSLTVKASYDAKLFGADYFEYVNYAEIDASVQATVSGAVKSSNLKNALGGSIAPVLTLYDGPISVIGTGLASVHLTATIPLDFEFKAAGTASLKYANKTGFSYNSDDGFQPIQSRSYDSSYKIEGTFRASVGPKIELSVMILGGIKGGISGQLGIRATGALTVAETGSATSRHACDGCISMDLSLFCQLNANLSCKITEKIQTDFLNANLISARSGLGKAFFSFRNDKASMFHNNAAFGWGECPNREYQVAVNTKGADGKELSGLPVTIRGADIATQTSPASVFLYTGSYTALAQFPSGTVTQDFSVEKSAVTVDIWESADAQLTGMVTESREGIPLSGAFVAAVSDDGSTTGSTTTDASGTYTMELKPGNYSVQASANGYLDVQQTVALSAGQQAQQDFSLQIDGWDWSYSDGVLTIWGTGPMDDYKGKDSKAPWNDLLSSITTVNIEPGISKIGEYAFKQCSALASVSIPDTVTRIGAGAFTNCTALTDVSIPYGVTHIENAAFSDCTALTSAAISDSVTYIGLSAFRGCSSLRNLTLPANDVTVDQSAFRDCISLTSVVMPDGFTRIGSRMFQGCTALTSVSIPDSVTLLLDNAFSGCTSLTSVVIPDGVPSINPFAFSGCTSLTSITIPASVTRISSHVFDKCSQLRVVYYAGTQEQWENIENHSGLSPSSQGVDFVWGS